MLYNLLETKNGKATVVMTDVLTKVNNRMKTLRASHRTKKIIYSIKKTEGDEEKYKKKPHNPCIGGGDAQTPRLTKWK